MEHVEGSGTRAGLVDQVLLAVDLVPRAEVVSYGDLAELCGTSPRRVGAIMREHGHEVAWWRVTSSYGDHPLMAQARPFWDEEGITLKPNQRGCRMSQFRTDLTALARRHATALTEFGATMEP